MAAFRFLPTRLYNTDCVAPHKQANRTSLQNTSLSNVIKAVSKIDHRFPDQTVTVHTSPFSSNYLHGGSHAMQLSITRSVACGPHSRVTPDGAVLQDCKFKDFFHVIHCHTIWINLCYTIVWKCINNMLLCDTAYCKVYPLNSDLFNW